ncbi:MAG: DUF5317 domain-containing protein [Chloroflexi bacterium]|nr:DUF5317 domain-containing protein [Chloroflexota bacterium]
MGGLPQKIVISISLHPRMLGLALLGFALQYFLVKEMNDPFAAKAVLGISHFLLLAVIVVNRRNLGFLVVGLGFALNLIAIYGNGGLMPIAPQAVVNHGLAGSNTELVEGSRFGAKNVLLDPASTRFYVLSDRIPTTFPRPFLVSVGDIVALAGLGIILAGQIAALARKDSAPVPDRTSPAPGHRRWLRMASRWRSRVLNAHAAMQETRFLEEWQEHWLKLTGAIRSYVTAESTAGRQAAERQFARERTWLLSRRWRFNDVWRPYQHWSGGSAIGRWHPLDPRQLVFWGPSDPYAGIYEGNSIAAVVSYGQVRSEQDMQLLMEALDLLDREVAHIFANSQRKGRGKAIQGGSITSHGSEALP